MIASSTRAVYEVMHWNKKLEMTSGKRRRTRNAPLAPSDTHGLRNQIGILSLDPQADVEVRHAKVMDWNMTRRTALSTCLTLIALGTTAHNLGPEPQAIVLLQNTKVMDWNMAN